MPQLSPAELSPASHSLTPPKWAFRRQTSEPTEAGCPASGWGDLSVPLHRPCAIIVSTMVMAFLARLQSNYAGPHYSRWPWIFRPLQAITSLRLGWPGDRFLTPASPETFNLYIVHPPMFSTAQHPSDPRFNIKQLLYIYPSLASIHLPLLATRP